MNLGEPIRVLLKVSVLALLSVTSLWVMGAVAGVYWFFARQGFLLTYNYLSQLT